MEKGISIVVVTYNRPKDVTEAIESLLNQSLKPIEIIVIDNGSNPPLGMKHKAKNLKLIRFDNEVGACNARNFGVNIAGGDYVAFIDDDAVADEHWLEEIQKGIDIGYDILGGSIKPIYEVPPPKWWDEKDFGYYAGVGNLEGWIWGSNMVVRKEVFKKAGFFRHDLGPQGGKHLGGEELDLINRAKSQGFSVFFVPRAVVYHKVKRHRMTLRHILKWEYYHGKSLKIRCGYKPLKTAILLLLSLLSIANIKASLSETPIRIKKLAWMVRLIGQLV